VGLLRPRRPSWIRSLTEIPLTLLGVERFARAIRDDGEPRVRREESRFEARRGLAEADAAAGLVARSLRELRRLPDLAELTMLYFAPPATRRPLAGSAAGPEPVSFLLHDDPAFGSALGQICGGPPTAPLSRLADCGAS